jgi:hypothetical protein
MYSTATLSSTGTNIYALSLAVYYTVSDQRCRQHFSIECDSKSIPNYTAEMTSIYPGLNNFDDGQRKSTRQIMFITLHSGGSLFIVAT